MFGKQHLFRLFVAIAIAASFAVAGARTAKAAGPHSRSVATARHAKSLRSQGVRIVTDTLGGNGRAELPASGGGSRTVA